MYHTKGSTHGIPIAVRSGILQSTVIRNGFLRSHGIIDRFALRLRICLLEQGRSGLPRSGFMWVPFPSPCWPTGASSPQSLVSMAGTFWLAERAREGYSSGTVPENVVRASSFMHTY